MSYFGLDDIGNSLGSEEEEDVYDNGNLSGEEDDEYDPGYWLEVRTTRRIVFVLVMTY